MLNIIYMEVKKVKRNSMFILSLFGVAFVPFLNFILSLSTQHRKNFKESFVQYAEDSNLIILLLIGILLYGLITAYCISREYEDDTLKNLLAIPVSRTRFIIGKSIFITLWIIVLTLLSYALIIIFSIIGGFTELTLGNILNQLFEFIKGGLLLIPLMFPIMFITIIFKKYIPAIVFSIISVVGSIIIANSKYIQIYPWTAPLTCFNRGFIHGTYDYPMYYSYISLITTGVLFFILSLIYFKKSDL